MEVEAEVKVEAKIERIRGFKETQTTFY